jgi:hypothetical protein
MHSAVPDRLAHMESLSGGSLDYYSILKEAIQKAEKNSAHVRALVYERARFNLKREVLFGHSTLALPELLRHVNELELAIARIEAGAADGSANLFNREQIPLVGMNRSGQASVQVMPPEPLPPLSSIRTAHQATRTARIIWAKVYTLTGLDVFALAFACMLFVTSVALVAALWRPAPAPPITTAQQLALTAPSPAPLEPQVSHPLPTSYGIYALAENKLVELEALSMRVPDARIALSAEISKPAPAPIGGNRPSFILFRRDLLNNAPGKIFVRVVARVARETKFVNGKAVTGAVENAWRIRNDSFELSVSPIPGKQEMVLVHGGEDFFLAPGRYVLVLNGFGYDFAVAGDVPSAAHCLERFEAANGSMFNECRFNK